MRRHGVRNLLMGGQACVFYGAAEFSRDTDLALLASEPNLATSDGSWAYSILVRAIRRCASAW
jgi:hypothetical protein